GDGIVLKALIRAIETCKWDMNDVSLVSGIGCSGRISSYVNCNTVHTTHGRPLPYAAGIKLMHPEKHVIVVSGDGDGLAIGGNHFIHACRRNMDMKYIVINNFIYGLTNSQASPTTPQGMWAVTQSFGNIDQPFDACNLAIGAGASFVARSTTLDLIKLEKILSASFVHKGFSFIEIFSGCPVNFGKKNDLGSPQAMDNWIDSIIVPQAKFAILSKEDKKGKFPTGILKQDAETNEYCAEYAKLVSRIQAEKTKKAGG
ncbi:MAG: 2-oxoglutarate ferredoxin oxidoreductase subunit beta, partial [Candidatus Parcubacteria bacterium]|nr:2-oxoglutarate ferredoxin oxidoreductase subunit beta [Candidatus Parcubacteria bacterium]